MLRTMIIAASALVLTAANANAMDDAERARQMEAYKSYPVEGAATTSLTSETVVTTQTAPAAEVPMPAQAAAPVKTQKEREMEAYQAWQANQPAKSEVVTTVSAGAAPTVITTGPVTTTTTTEKTTSTNYTVTKRKVGLVGNRPYPATTETLEGGVIAETTVNGVETSKTIVKPDEAITTLKNETAEGEYYSEKPEAKVYQNANTNVQVFNSGRLND